MLTNGWETPTFSKWLFANNERVDEVPIETLQQNEIVPKIQYNVELDFILTRCHIFHSQNVYLLNITTPTFTKNIERFTYIL